MLLVDDAFADLVPAIRQRHAGLEAVVHAGDGNPPEGMLGYEALIAEGPAVEDTRRGGNALAGLFYTGGTTGFSKGVVLSHANIIISTLGSLVTTVIGFGGRFLIVTSMFHLAGLIPIISTSITGGAVVIVPAFYPVAVMRAIELHHVTDTVLIPIMLQLLVDHPQCADHDLSSLLRLVYGGSPLAVPVLDRARKVLRGASSTQSCPRWRLCSCLRTMRYPAPNPAGCVRVAELPRTPRYASSGLRARNCPPAGLAKLCAGVGM